MEYKEIIYEKEGNIVTITFNRPEKANTWDFPGLGGMFDQFNAALDETADDDEVKVVILKGAGKGFSGGHDLSKVGFIYGMGTGQPGERRPSQRIRLKVDRAWFELHQKIFYHPKLTIAQIHGYCVEEGMIIAEECDMAIAAADAKLGHRGQRIGPAGGSIPNLPIIIMTIGLKRTLNLLLTGELIDGVEAERIGLISRVVPPDKLEEEVQRVAKTLCMLPRDGIAIGKSHRHTTYDKLGLNSGFIDGYINHTLFTNIRFEPDEHNLFKERRDKGTKAAFQGRDARFKDLD